METLSKFISKSRFFVSGGAGFIGSNLCEYLVSNQAKNVICFDNLVNGKISNIQNLIGSPNFEFINGDITNYQFLKSKIVNIDFVLHQAAWGSVPKSITYPLDYTTNNILGTHNIFDVARLNGVKKVVYASSSSVYGDHPSLPKIEGFEGNLLSPYALSKKVNEVYGKLYWDIYKLPTIGLRYFNVFGKRQNPDGDYAAIIPKFIKLIMNNHSPEVFGDGNQSRDFTFIDNVIQANINACFFGNNDCYGKVYNVAYGKSITINEVFNTIKNELNSNVHIIYKNSRFGDIKHSLADISNAKKAFNYNPKISFLEGLKISINWYKNHL